MMNHPALIEFVKWKAVVFKVDLFSRFDKEQARYLNIFYFQLQSPMDLGTEAKEEASTTPEGRTSPQNN